MEKSYKIYYVENNKVIFENGHSATVKAKSSIEALKIAYTTYFNCIAGDFKNFTYHAEISLN